MAREAQPLQGAGDMPGVPRAECPAERLELPVVPRGPCEAGQLKPPGDALSDLPVYLNRHGWARAGVI